MLGKSSVFAMCHLFVIFFVMDFQLDSYTSLKTIYGIDTNLKIFYSDNLSAVRLMHWYLFQPFLFHASEGFDSTLEHVSFF